MRHLLKTFFCLCLSILLLGSESMGGVALAFSKQNTQAESVESSMKQAASAHQLCHQAAMLKQVVQSKPHYMPASDHKGNAPHACCINHCISCLLFLEAHHNSQLPLLGFQKEPLLLSTLFFPAPSLKRIERPPVSPA